MTDEEEDHAEALVRILGIDLRAFLRQNPDLGHHVVVARANGGFRWADPDRVVRIALVTGRPRLWQVRRT